MNRILELPRPLPINFSWFSQFQGNILFWFLMSSLQKQNNKFKIWNLVHCQVRQGLKPFKIESYKFVQSDMAHSHLTSSFLKLSFQTLYCHRNDPHHRNDLRHRNDTYLQSKWSRHKFSEPWLKWTRDFAIYSILRLFMQTRF